MNAFLRGQILRKWCSLGSWLQRNWQVIHMGGNRLDLTVIAMRGTGQHSEEERAADDKSGNWV